MTEISYPRPTRRDVLRASLGLGGAMAFGGQPASGADDLKDKTVVFASWGGAYQDAEKVSYCDPFAQMTRADDNFGDAFARQEAKLMSYERLICDID